MFEKPHCPVIAIEEHYWDDELEKTFTGGEAGRPGEQFNRLHDFGALRVKEMDDAGIDVQVLSHGAPSTQKLAADTAAAVARGGSTIGCIKSTPAIRRAWPLSPRCRLRCPKPPPTNSNAPPRSASRAPCCTGSRTASSSTTRAFGRSMRARKNSICRSELAIRLVLSGVFEKYPKLKIILGHLGETLPFLVWRIDTTLKRPGGKAANFRDIFCNNFYVTTSGNFSNPALLCCVMEMGIDRILFAVDWPFVPNPPGTKWMESVPLCDEDKAKIRSGNAKRLLKM